LDENKSLLLAKITDEARIAEKEHKVIGTSFCDPAAAREIEHILSGMDNIAYYRWGGYPEAERVIYVLYPFYMDKPDTSLIQALKIQWNPKFYQIEHRDILGSLIGAGIKREKIGDIIMDEGFAYAFISKELAPYISASLQRAGKAPVSADAVSCEKVILSEPKLKSITTTVASPRLDSILSSCFGLSRTKAVPYIENGSVSVNWIIVQKPDYTVAPGDVLSVRGLGRGRVKEFGRTTKKDRMFVVLEKYI
jgi:RNA-binding protein YlmH